MVWAKEQIKVRQYEFIEINSSVSYPTQNIASYLWSPKLFGWVGKGSCNTIRVDLILIHFFYTLTESIQKIVMKNQRNITANRGTPLN